MKNIQKQKLEKDDRECLTGVGGAMRQIRHKGGYQIISMTSKYFLETENKP